jgi:hypothetical protein
LAFLQQLRSGRFCGRQIKAPQSFLQIQQGCVQPVHPSSCKLADPNGMMHGGNPKTASVQASDFNFAISALKNELPLRHITKTY